MNITKMEMVKTRLDHTHFPTSSRPLLWGIALTLLISVFLRINSIFSLGDRLYEAGINSILLYSIVFGAQFIMGFILVVYLLPYLTSEPDLISSIRSQVRPSRILVATGIVSGGIFLIIATGIANALGIFQLDWSLLFGLPDVYVDPDVVGWYYFILALVPAIWEEIVFRGIILFGLRHKYSDRKSILLSSLLFSLYHLSVILTKPIDTVIGGVIMSFFYGLAWGSIVLKTNSIIPTMIAHYIIDTFGILFLNADNADPIILTQFMLLVTILYPILHWLIFRFVSYHDLSLENNGIT